jgi:hypothetical protein
MDAKTYNRLLDLQKELEKPEVAEWYQTELLFTPANFKTMKDNVDQAISILASRKDNKTLYLDADLGAALEAKQETGTSSESTDVVSTSLPTITGSVGRWEKGARNIPGDVETVQRLLQTASQKLQAPQLDPKGIDGKIARLPAKSNTAAAIEALQSRCNISIGSLIEPGSETWRALLQAAGAT